MWGVRCKHTCICVCLEVYVYIYTVCLHMHRGKAASHSHLCSLNHPLQRLIFLVYYCKMFPLHVPGNETFISNFIKYPTWDEPNIFLEEFCRTVIHNWRDSYPQWYITKVWGNILYFISQIMGINHLPDTCTLHPLKNKPVGWHAVFYLKKSTQKRHKQKLTCGKDKSVVISADQLKNDTFQLNEREREREKTHRGHKTKMHQSNWLKWSNLKHMSKLSTNFSQYFQDTEEKSERLVWVRDPITLIESKSTFPARLQEHLMDLFHPQSEIITNNTITITVKTNTSCWVKSQWGKNKL